MAIVLRLEGLDVKAESEDIRIFFNDLHIPDGGVLIVGGHLREAFIVFTNERDGLLAMRQSGKFLKGSQVTLYISSMAELYNKTKSRLQQKKKKTKPPITDERSLPTPNPPPPIAQSPDKAHLSNAATALMFGLVNVLQQLQSNQKIQNNEVLPVAESTAVVSDERRAAEESYVRLFGLPASVSKEDICHFFKGLQVQEVIVNVKLGLHRGCLVKFANFQDGCHALRFNQHRLGSVCVEVRGASEKMWINAVKECANHAYEEMDDIPVSPETHCEPQRIPVSEPQRDRDSLKCQTLYRQRSPPRAKRCLKGHLSSHPQKKPKSDCTSSTGLSPLVECCIMVKNLPKNITKTEIKELFGCPNIPHNNIVHLLDEDRQRTDTAFVKFDKAEDYVYAMNLNGCHVASQAINVSTVSEERMEAMLTSSRGEHLQHLNSRQNAMKKQRRKKPSMIVEPTAQTCLYVRNMPGDVQKSEILELFYMCKPKEDKIFLMHDKYGNGIGEAVVQFKSERVAKQAQEKLHGKSFLGTEVFLTCINVKQMGDILKGNR